MSGGNIGKKILTVVGARPQFVKATVVSHTIRQLNCSVNEKSRLHEVIVHTGQHYDENMSAVFFREMQLPEPTYHLGVGGLSHGAMTGRMLEKIEEVILKERPALMLVYGDTNSTLAGALAASKVGVPVAHVEAGLRSFNRQMPEEINRIAVDHISGVLFCPTETAVKNLKREGVWGRIDKVGDVMCDSVLLFKGLARRSNILETHSLRPKQFFLATLHRPANTDDSDRLHSILAGFATLNEKIVLAAHPRCRMAITRYRQVVPPNVLIIDPVGYLDMLHLEQAAKAIFTDSGGVQKEAYILGVPCITMREETEWTETVALGWNQLVGADKERMVAAAGSLATPGTRPPVFGDGRAAERIVKILMHDDDPEPLP